MKPSLAIVMGDVSMDMVVAVANQDHILRLSGTEDVTLIGKLQLLPGGTAFLFSEAAHTQGAFEPFILAALGDDTSSHLIIQSLESMGVSTSGLEIFPEASTDLICMAALDQGRRLMFHQANPTSNCLTARWVASRLQDLLTEEIALVWISGYAVVAADSARTQAARHLASWARRQSIPVVLDLVPHDFIRYFGSLKEIELRVGEVNLIVAELKTLMQIGFGEQGSEGQKAMASAAVTCSRSKGGGVLVQHRTDVDTYSQALAINGVLISAQDYSISDSGLRGMGDRMAILALAQLYLER
jgi:sugar/nucleoside kinase (ribokinase family)